MHICTVVRFWISAINGASGCFWELQQQYCLYFLGWFFLLNTLNSHYSQQPILSTVLAPVVHSIMTQHNKGADVSPPILVWKTILDMVRMLGLVPCYIDIRNKSDHSGQDTSEYEFFLTGLIMRLGHLFYELRSLLWYDEMFVLVQLLCVWMLRLLWGM